MKDNKPAPITDEERTLRAEAVRHANGHNAMDGLFGTPLGAELQARYIAGELSMKAAILETKRLYGIA